MLTSGGDAPGMNPAVRAVVRTAMDAGSEVVAVCEGYAGLVQGGPNLRRMSWNSVGGILPKGGTVIGTGRSTEFLTPEGRRRGVATLLGAEISRLVVIGGDGSLTGALQLWREWADHSAALVAAGEVAREVAERHPGLVLAGVPASIDNDIYGSDMTIGADSALHRITEAVDTISSTATSHQRTFVVETMGRRCGYLAVMGALATGADWALIPEVPPAVPDWRRTMVDRLEAGRRAGRRDSIVIVAEGAQDASGRRITSLDVRDALQELLGEEVRLTILGHVQRGGSPSAFDRYLSTVLGHAAVLRVLSAAPSDPPQLAGVRSGRLTFTSLEECVGVTREVVAAVDEGDSERVLELRGKGFRDAFRTLKILVRSLPHPPPDGQRRLRLAVVHSGGLAPGMNTAVRVAVRIGLDRGHAMLGVRNGFAGLVAGDLEEMGWMSMRGWASLGGAELGTNRKVPAGKDLYAIARTLEQQEIDGLLVIGGWSAYEAVARLYAARGDYPAFQLPVVVLPATIDNNLPGAETSVGADTALNSIVGAVDKIKQSAVASRRCFVVEVMGRHCGYLALVGGLATGAERVYLNEEGVSLDDLRADLEHLRQGFLGGKRLGLVIRNELANPIYTTGFMTSLLAEEGAGLFEARQAILGHLQQGGNPTPFDRIQASRLAARCIEWLMAEAGSGRDRAVFVNDAAGASAMTSFEDFFRLVDVDHQRPREQWWMELRPIARVLAQPGPRSDGPGEE